jgi:hypothetical protein
MSLRKYQIAICFSFEYGRQGRGGPFLVGLPCVDLVLRLRARGALGKRWVWGVCDDGGGGDHDDDDDVEGDVDRSVSSSSLRTVPILIRLRICWAPLLALEEAAAGYACLLYASGILQASPGLCLLAGLLLDARLLVVGTPDLLNGKSPFDCILEAHEYQVGD